VGNYAEAFRKMLHWIDVVEINEPQEVFPAYQRALDPAHQKSTLLIEHGNYYNQK
jgi:hypothetical protein